MRVSALLGRLIVPQSIFTVDHSRVSTLNGVLVFSQWMVEAEQRIRDADAYILVSGEYNCTIPPALSNMMDHFPPSAYAHKPSGIVTYSPSASSGGGSAKWACHAPPSASGTLTLKSTRALEGQCWAHPCVHCAILVLALCIGAGFGFCQSGRPPRPPPHSILAPTSLLRGGTSTSGTLHERKEIWLAKLLTRGQIACPCMHSPVELINDRCDSRFEGRDPL